MKLLLHLTILGFASSGFCVYGQDSPSILPPTYIGTVLRTFPSGAVQQGTITLVVDYSGGVSGDMVLGGLTTHYQGGIAIFVNGFGFIKEFTLNGELLPGTKSPVTLKNDFLIGGNLDVNGVATAFRLKKQPDR